MRKLTAVVLWGYFCILIFGYAGAYFTHKALHSLANRVHHHHPNTSLDVEHAIDDHCAWIKPQHEQRQEESHTNENRLSLYGFVLPLISSFSFSFTIKKTKNTTLYPTFYTTPELPTPTPPPSA
ncbi:hypothetical protein [Roseivirga thermotolerans]|uniref:Transmembrane protein n=1 Tax=Roseivirga thermotolerans TaxID=1758176 RepID=A0ABQ3I4Z3_9BACT|nr:hypothetical protein [Roseivirga thermotolerans]GHE51224.1 hypothetical protein GCM10011340_01690 [Roseivirga thermotolerans]